MTAEATAQLEAFQRGECNWVEMTIVDEVINLVGFRTVSASDSLQSFIDTESARYNRYDSGHLDFFSSVTHFFSNLS